MERSLVSVSKSFKSDLAINSEFDERRTIFSGVSGNNLTSDVQDEYLMRDAAAKPNIFCSKLIESSFSGRGRA